MKSEQYEKLLQEDATKGVQAELGGDADAPETWSAARTMEEVEKVGGELWFSAYPRRKMKVRGLEGVQVEVLEAVRRNREAIIDLHRDRELERTGLFQDVRQVFAFASFCQEAMAGVPGKYPAEQLSYLEEGSA